MDVFLIFQIFTRILRNLHLQVGTSNIDYAITRQQVYDIGVCSLWIVAMMVGVLTGAS